LSIDPHITRRNPTGRRTSRSFVITTILMVTFWKSEDAVQAFAGDDISVAKYYDFDESFLLELEPSSTHYETYDR
jgi:hypothetical protein